MRNKKLKPVWHFEFAPWKYPSNWIRNGKQLRAEVRDFIRRGRYGVATSDCWNLGNYILSVMNNGINIFKEDTVSYPGFLTEKEWDNVLERMIYLIEVINKDSTEGEESELLFEQGFNENFKWKDGYQEKWFNSVKDYIEYQQECRDELCDLLKQYLPELWW